MVFAGIDIKYDMLSFLETLALIGGKNHLPGWISRKMDTS